MEHKQHNHNGYGQGFIVGVLVGVVITLLFTTKKGRELFKEWTEKGLDKFSELEKKLQETTESIEEDFEDFEEGNDYVESVKEPRQSAQEEKKEEKVATKEHSAPKPSHVRRFFRAKKS